MIRDVSLPALHSAFARMCHNCVSLLSYVVTLHLEIEREKAEDREERKLGEEKEQNEYD